MKQLEEEFAKELNGMSNPEENLKFLSKKWDADRILDLIWVDV
jgi:hypothetical protein